MQQSLLSESDPGLRLLFSGDVRLTAPGTDSILDEAVQSYFDAHDLRCCNFEGAAAHDSPVTTKKAGVGC